MKEFFMTSAIPYWLLFLITVIPVGYSAFVTFRSDNDARISRNTMLTISGLLLASALSVILFYIMLGGNALWWVTGKEIGFWSKLLRVIPLSIFLLLQGAAPFAYKIFMEKYFHCDSLSVKSQFISGSYCPGSDNHFDFLQYSDPQSYILHYSRSRTYSGCNIFSHQKHRLAWR